MTDKTEMVLVSRDELQQLIGASVRCAFEEYRQVEAPQDTSEYYTINQPSGSLLQSRVPAV